MAKNLALFWRKMAKNLALSLRKWHKKNLIGENGGERKINPSANPAQHHVTYAPATFKVARPRVLTRILKTGIIESIPGKSWSQIEKLEFDLENLEFSVLAEYKKFYLRM